MNPIISGISVFRTESFDCECFSYDHSIRFAFDPTEEDIRFQELWVECHFPCNRSLWQRLVLATKYILRIGPQDWTYGSWILKHEDEARLRKFFMAYEAVVMNLENKARENAPKQTDSV